MPAASLSRPHIVTRPDDLKRLAETLSRQPVVAIDTESNSLFAYREQVCLLQVSTPDADYVVDPLILIDLSHLAPTFADPSIEKIFHAAEYDIICMKRDFDFHFTNLFDTLIAARILGRKAVGLGDLLQAEFDITQDKRHQRADWGQRPLPTPLLTYAQMDTHYLIALRNRLQVELAERGLLSLAVEDFARVCYVNGQSPNSDEEICWRMNGVRDLTPQQAAVLLELCRYRQDMAQSLDRPLFKVMSDKTLLTIAGACPTKIDQLRRLPGMTERQIHRHGQAILQVVQRGLQARPIHPPRSQRPAETYMARLDALREWRKLTARKMGVESDIVLPRDLLYILAEKNPRRFEDLAAVMDSVPWRLEHFGEQILSIVRGG